ncbi:E3 ubiquitin-protein ligase BRE1A-like isoform X1 [Scylla paramamosain]|uniref:E3 ubiquitin-protein ligase BRE1A-like isoform X1 n=1 Tax=Scylla paramamosain TaxID=85552 RepID=UPI003083CEC9
MAEMQAAPQQDQRSTVSLRASDTSWWGTSNLLSLPSRRQQSPWWSCVGSRRPSVVTRTAAVAVHCWSWHARRQGCWGQIWMVPVVRREAQGKRRTRRKRVKSHKRRRKVERKRKERRRRRRRKMEKERRKIRRKEMPQKEKIEIKNVTRQNSELHALITEYKVTPSEEKDKDGMSSCENSEAKCTDTKGKLLGQVATLTSEVSRLESECSSLQVQLDCERDKYNKLLGESLAHEKLSEDVITEPKGETTGLGGTEL